MSPRRLTLDVLSLHLSTILNRVKNLARGSRMSICILIGSCLLAKRLLDQAQAIDEVEGASHRSGKPAPGNPNDGWLPISSEPKTAAELRAQLGGLGNLPEDEQFPAFQDFLRELGKRYIVCDRFLTNIADYELQRADEKAISIILETLKSLKFSAEALESPFILGQAFLSILEDQMDTEFGQYSTSGDLANLVAQLADLRPGISISDPFVGVGRLIVQSVLQLQQVDSLETNNPTIFGQEIGTTPWVVCELSMALLGLKTRIELGDTFLEPKLSSGGMLDHFDLVVSAPPFGVELAKSERLMNDPYMRFGPSGPASDLAPLQHIVASLEENGQAIVVIYPKLLFAQGAAGQVRNNWIESDWVEAVISLPPGIFAPTTALPGAILMLRKGKDRLPKNRRGRVLMIRAEELMGSSRTRGKRTIEPNDRNAILDAYKKFQDGPFSRVVSIVEILNEQEGDLRPSRYFKGENIPSSGPQDLSAAMVELTRLDEEASASRNRLDHLVRGFIAHPLN